MLMRLTFTACAALVLSACVITTGDTSDTFGTTTNDLTTTGGTTVVDPTTGGTTADGTTTSGTTAVDPDTGTTVSGTTGPDVTTTGPTTGLTTTTDPDTTAGTTGIDMAGCGWYARGKYYACFPDGEPGLEDPDMIDPIACKDGVEEGVPCTDADGPVNGIGCCDGDILYFCDAGAVFRQECLGG